MSPEMQARLIFLAKAVAVLGVLILGFLWIVSMAAPDASAPSDGASQTNHIATPEVAKSQPPSVDGTPAEQPQPNAPAPDAQAAANPATPVTGTATAHDPGDEFYRMGLYAQALQYWRTHARLGVEYMEGKDGVTARDYAAAHKYYGIAAARGDARAQFDIGTLYDYGHGVEKSAEMAFEWYRKAAGRGHPQAQWTLATKLEKGEGAPKNEVEALKWYYIAADNGFRVAPSAEPDASGNAAPFAYEVLAEQLTKEQAEEARTLANDYRPLTD
jgi:hypothetical protein